MKMGKGKSLFAGILLLGIVGACSANAVSHLDREAYTATVVDKQVKRYGKSDKYLIYTKLQDGKTRVFENTDSILEGKVNSSDLWADIEKGKTYELKTYGWRVPLLSSYENIIGIEEKK